MRITKDNHLSILHQVFGWRGRNYFSMSVLAGFSLEPADRLLEESDMWDRLVSALPRGQVLDLSMPKPGGEVLALGKCFAPKGRETRAATAFFSVGRLEKRVEVFGNRYFKLGRIKTGYIKPQPFLVMDLVWENAFGGPEYGENPVGKGMVPVISEKGNRLLPLPNIEDPGNLMVFPDDRPKPVGVGPMGLDWPVKLKNLGKFDRTWFMERWPGLPDDFNFEYFNLAPRDQRIEGYFQGDEMVLIRGMHPDKHEILTRLPGLRCRAFISRQKNDDQEFLEIHNHLDTVYLIPHLNTGLIIWHGTAPVQDDEAGDVDYVAAYCESLSESPKPWDYYLQKIMAPEVEESPEEEEVLPEAPETEEPIEAPEPAPKPPLEMKGAPAVLAALEGIITQRQAKLKEGFKDLGFEPDKLKSPPAPELEPAAKETVELSPQEKLAKLERSIAEREEKHQQALKELGIEPDPITAEKELAPPEVPVKPKTSAVQDGQAFIDSLKGTGVATPETLDEIQKLLDEHKALPLELAGLLAAAKISKPETPVEQPVEEPSASKTYTREEVLAGYAEGQSFAGSDLTGLNLSECDLPDIDLRGAVLEKVDFSRTNLSRAKLVGTVLTGANLTEANLIQGQLSRTNASRAILTGSDMSRADMTESDFTGADLTRAKLVEADLSGGIFNEALLTNADCTALLASKAGFENADLNDAVFVRADLTEADMSGARMENTILSHAKARDLRLNGVQGQGVHFESADLSKSRAGEQASFRQGRFGRANFEGASWDDTDLTEADFSRADMKKAQLNKCRSVRANLFAVNAKNADLSKSDFTDAKMPACNLMGGSLRKTRLIGADIQGANLYGVDMYKSVLGETNIEEANTDRTLLSVRKSAL